MARKRRNNLYLRARYAAEHAVLRLALTTVPTLPYCAIRTSARFLGTLAHQIDRRGRSTSRENLQAAFGETLSPSDRSRIARRSYQNLARCVLELFWNPRLTPENYQRYIRWNFLDPASYEQAKANGAIWITPHYGNFEWLAFLAAFQGHQFPIIAENFKNPALTPLFSSLRERSGHTVIPQEQALARLLRHLRRGGHAALLTDLTVPPGKAAAVIQCFGLQTCVTRLHALLAFRVGVPVIPALSIPESTGGYEFRIWPALHTSAFPDENAMTQACWDLFEPIIQQRPEYWIWMYKHWRHLPEGAEPSRYPAYANRSRHFDRINPFQPASPEPPRPLNRKPEEPLPPPSPPIHRRANAPPAPPRKR